MLIFYKKYYPGSGWLMRILIRLAVLLKACWATISAPLRKKAKAVKHRRLLILCREDHFEEVKAVCLKAMPDLEFVNLWDLDVERVMDAICRKNQMKGFTGLRFLLPRCPLRADALVYGQAREQESGLPYIYEEEWSACLSNPWVNMLLSNDRVRLRALEPEDLELLYRWENDPELWEVGNTLAPYSRYILKEYIAGRRPEYL